MAQFCLGQLITILEATPQDLVVEVGFGHPHSYRGFYDELAFEPVANVTVAQMLESAREALGVAMPGWKGGEFVMDKYTPVWIAKEGRSGETLGDIMWAFMLGHPEVVLEDDFHD